MVAHKIVHMKVVLMSASPIVLENKIYIPRATSRRTCYANRYMILSSDGKILAEFSAEKRPQVIEKTPEMRYLIHVYETTRSNIYVTVFDLRENRVVAEVSTLMPLKTILAKISQLPEHLRKIVSDELFY